MVLYTELAEHYYAIESNHRNLLDDIALILEVSSGTINPSLLDLGCGTGEHMDALSRRGFLCTGIDISDDMLKTARKRFPDAGRFIKADITKLDFYEEYNIAISLFGTLNYLIENEKIDNAFWNIWRALKPGGKAVLEIWNSFPIEKIRNKEVGLVSTTRKGATVIERHRGFTLLEGENGTIVQVDYRYLIAGNGAKREITDRHIMRAFSRDEISTLLSANGFRPEAVYAGTRREGFNETSNRMVVVALKG